MLEIEKLDDELYCARYGLPRIGNAKILWEQIKNRPKVLREAVKIKRNKWNTGDLVNGLAICDAMLTDYRNVDQVAYHTLIQSIYANTDIARIVIDGASNGGDSYLLMSLWNHELKLTEKQKAFAVNEAMNKIGTTRYKKEKEEYSYQLEKQGINDDIVTILDIDGCVNPIGAKTKNEYFYDTFSMISATQAHGIGAFDIRYQILRNPNWSLEEKQKLIMDFWCDDEVYDEYLEEWEWAVVNDSANFKKCSITPFDRYELFNEVTYDMLLKFYGNQETTDRIWEEVEFCKQMHQLRPPQWEKESIVQKTLGPEKPNQH